tara:strand:+ start:4800 stop:5186 length:387 start_codon:yes stop_codon:yes gene_type:complete
MFARSASESSIRQLRRPRNSDVWMIMRSSGTPLVFLMGRWSNSGSVKRLTAAPSRNGRLKRTQRLPSRSIASMSTAWSAEACAPVSIFARISSVSNVGRPTISCQPMAVGVRICDGVLTSRGPMAEYY